MSSEESLKCPICGNPLERYVIPMANREQKRVLACEVCMFRIPDDSFEKYEEGGRDSADQVACEAIENRICDMRRMCSDVKEMLADAGNLYEPFIKAEPEDPRFRGWFDRMADIDKAIHAVAWEVHDYAFGLRMMVRLKAREKCMNPEGKE